MKISAENLRVYLITPTTHDAQAIKDNLDSPEIALNSPGIVSPYGVEDALMFIEMASREYELARSFHTCIKLLDGKLIGLCALARTEVDFGRAEIGYVLGRDHWGSGYAKEALSLMMSFGFKKLNLGTIYAKVPAYNERSIRLLNSIGFKNEGAIKEDVINNGILVDGFLFSMKKKDYKSGIDIVVDGY